MTLRKGSDYLDFDGQIELSFDTNLLGTINVNMKSYSFDIANTSKNRGLLGITSPVDPNIFTSELWVLNNGFNDIQGKISVELVNDDTITINFFSSVGSNLSLLDMSIKDIYSLNTAPSPSFTYQGNEFDGTSWFLAPPVNTGNNQNLVSLNFQDDGFYNNLPCIFIKSIIQELLTQTGIKLTGSVLNDALYNKLLLSSDSIYVEYDERYIEENTVYVYLASSQAVPLATTAKINFATNPPDYYDNHGNWDNGGHRFIGYGFSDQYYLFQIEYNISIVSAPTVDPLLQIFEGGVAIIDIPIVHITANDFQGSVLIPVLVSPGTDYDVRVTAPTLNNIVVQNSITHLKIYPFNTYQYNGKTLIGNTNNLFARLLVPDISGTDLIKNALGIFCPLIQYNTNTGTIKIDFFKDIKHNTEVDWSDYVKNYSFSYYEDFISSYGKKSRVSYADSDEQSIKDYNKKFKTGFGSGVLNVENDFIEKDKEIFKSIFGASTSSFNESVIQMIPDFPFFKRNMDSSKIVILSESITIVGCVYVVQFTCSENHGLKVGDYVCLSDFQIGSEYNGFARVRSIISATDFTIQMRYAQTTGLTGAFAKVSLDSNKLNNKLLIAVPNVVPETDFYPGTLWYDCSHIYDHTNLYCYAYFINPLPNGPNNNLIPNICVDIPHVAGMTQSLSLKDIYWREFESALNNPTVLVANMLLPESEIFNLDISKPIRIKTKDFNSQFILLSCHGYVDKNTECEIRLLRI